MMLQPDFGPDNARFPPLPELRDPWIAEQVFTHRSLHARPTHIFEDLPEDPSPDNEKFEHLGDTVLGLTVTNLMLDMYPGLRVGPSTKIRAMIVGNSTLADISLRYKLPDKLRLHPAQALTLRASTNIQADVFESYVGGLYLDQGLDAAKSWMYLLFSPYAISAYLFVRHQYGLPPALPISLASPRTPHINIPKKPIAPMDPLASTQPTTIGHLALFNQSLQRANRQVEWVYEDPFGPVAGVTSDGYYSTEDPRAKGAEGALIYGTKTTPVWFVQVLVDGELYGRGQGNTKKFARNEAAKEGLKKLGIIV